MESLYSDRYWKMFDYLIKLKWKIAWLHGSQMFFISPKRNIASISINRHTGEVFVKDVSQGFPNTNEEFEAIIELGDK